MCKYKKMNAFNCHVIEFVDTMTKIAKARGLNSHDACRFSAVYQRHAVTLQHVALYTEYILNGKYFRRFFVSVCSVRSPIRPGAKKATLRAMARQHNRQGRRPETGCVSQLGRNSPKTSGIRVLQLIISVKLSGRYL